MPRWAMVMDLRKCIGCKTCSAVCKEMNKVPTARSWRRVIECNVGQFMREKRIFLPMNCMQCDNPPCVDVCPTSATYQRPDGIVDINYDLCVGCGSCVVACPYSARDISKRDRIVVEENNQSENFVIKDQDRIGICTKCNFCISRIESAITNGYRPGVDFQATPYCVHFCTGNALFFGDLEDHESNVSQLIKENNTLRLHEELGTEPSIYYILE